MTTDQATARQYMIVVQQIVGNEHDWTTTYSREGHLFADRAEAIAHGLDVLGHDDFNIATLDGGRLVAFGWGHEDFGPDDYDLAEIARHLCLPLGGDELRREVAQAAEEMEEQ